MKTNSEWFDEEKLSDVKDIKLLYLLSRNTLVIFVLNSSSYFLLKSWGDMFLEVPVTNRDKFYIIRKN